MSKLLFSGKINVDGLHSFHKLQTALSPWIVTVLDASVSEGEGPDVRSADTRGGWESPHVRPQATGTWA